MFYSIDRELITQELLKNCFDYKDGFLYWKHTTGSRAVAGKVAGSLFNHKSGSKAYFIGFYGHRYRSARLVFMWHHGYFPPEIDHIDRNPLNDKIENLRAATSAQNKTNRGSAKNSTSKYLGVSWNTKYSRWVAQICFNYKQHNLGYFDSEIEVALAYNRAAVRHHGEYANLNIVNP